MTAPWDRRRRSEQARVEELVLGPWLPAAVGFSSTWSQRVRDAGLSTRSLRSREDLALLAPTREVDLLRDSGPGAPGLLMRPTEDQIKAHATRSTLMDIARSIRREGRSGQRRAVLTEYKPIHVHRGGVDADLAIAYSRRDLDRLHRAGARAAAVLGLDDTDYLVSAVPAGPTLEWWGVYHLGLGSSMLALHPRGAGDPLARAIASFRLLPVTAVAVLAGEAVELAATITESAEVSCDRVDTVVVVGPPPDAERRAAIADAWRAAGANRDVRVRALWAPSEARAMWAECAEGGTGLHTYPDMEVLEIIDPQTGATSPSDGDLTYTSAGWHGSALLRYQTGAYVEGLSDDACPACGRTVPRILGEPLPAAWQPAITTEAGGERADLRGAAVVLAGDPAVEVWRIEASPTAPRRRTHRVLVEVAGRLAQEDADGLARRLRAAVGTETLEVELIADPVVVERRVEELGSVFADLT
ncbi:MAG: hypothetical protein KY461_14260 [Actinobacteria bacterium]|nr:hypothetical protein [Actinomycetota bacterium]